MPKQILLRRFSRFGTIERQSHMGSGRKPSRAPLFPKAVPDRSFPKWAVGDGETGKISLNEWRLSEARIASINFRVWGVCRQSLRQGYSVGVRGAGQARKSPKHTAWGRQRRRTCPPRMSESGG